MTQHWPEGTSPLAHLSDEDLELAIREASDFDETDWYDVGGEIQSQMLDALLTEQEERTKEDHGN